jgi:hypothetical protein
MKTKKNPDDFNGRRVEIQQFQRELFVRQFSLSQAGISPGVFAFWRKNGLIDFVEDNKWARLNFLQITWVKLLISLRGFGLSLEKLKKVHEHFFVRAYKDQFAKQYYKQTADQINQDIKKGIATKADKDRLQEIQESLKHDSLMHIHNRDLNYFSNLLNGFLNNRKETGILIYENASIDEYSNDFYYVLNEETNQYEVFKDKPDFLPPYIYVSLPFFILEFLDNETIIEYMPAMNILTEDELQLIGEMRKKNVREIRIQLNNGKLKRIETDIAGNLPKEQADDIKRAIGLKNYQRITVEMRDEKTITFVKTKKIIK